MADNGWKFRAKVVLVLVIFLTPVWVPFLHHSLMQNTKMDIVVVDKTVGPSYREHQALYWILKHEKIVPKHSGPGTGDPDGDGIYNYATDYYGFHPIDNSSTNILDIDLDPKKIDVLYLADTYGASETYGLAAVEEKNYTAGISAAEASAIRAFARDGGSIYAEWNVLGDPTYNDTAAETIMSEVLHVDYYGYGAFFANLANASQTMKNLYQISTGLNWNFTGPGIAIVLDSAIHEKVTVVVLDKKDIQDVPIPVRIDITCVNCITQNVAGKLALDMGYWFEILKPQNDVEQLATYKLETTDSGDLKLAENGLNFTFPALLQYNGSYKAVYVAADATDYIAGYPPAWQQYFSGIEILMRFNIGNIFTQSPMQQFFWKFYQPIVVNSLAWLAGSSEEAPIGLIEMFTNECMLNNARKIVKLDIGWSCQ